MNKKGLGKGLGALLSLYEEDEVQEENLPKNEKSTPVGLAEEKVTSNSTEKKAVDTQNNNTAGILEIDVDLIYPNPNQPRKNFDETALKELAESIKTHGIIQPIVINKDSDGKYMIIAGERRWRAAKLAGLYRLPCVVKNYTERQVKEVSIIENLQREDLNPIEAARAIKQLMDEYNFTQEVVADRIGKSRPSIANTLRLLSLSPDVVALIEKDRLSAGHAKCLVVINNFDEQLRFATMACDNKMSVRDLEKVVKKYLNPKANSITDKETPSMELRDLINEMQRVFATKVSVLGNDRKGRIYIDYYSKDDLDRLCNLIELIKTKELTLKELSEFNKRKK